MKAIGFNAGQFGDVMMGTVAARAFKEQNPDAHLTMGVAEKYSAIEPLFKDHKYFDDTHIWKGYNDWPNVEDNLYLSTNRFDKRFNAMPQHTNAFWYLSTHQTAELCAMHGLEAPKNLQVELTNHSVKHTSNKLVCLSLFGETRGEEKSVSLKQANQIVELVRRMGYTPVQLGLESEPDICTNRYKGDFVSSVQFMAKSDLLITIDTAMSWIASGYSHPTVGLYGYSYYPLAKSSKNWQPVNPNAIYVESPRVSDIILDRIEAAINSIKS